MSRPADQEMIGRNIAGKFVVEKFLGGGAMGAVYKAYQKSIEKHVAIKVLHREFGQEPNFVSRFEREAKAASLLDHVNLMRVLDFGREPDGVCYIAMELLDGRSLFQVLKDDGQLSNERIAGLIRQTLAGLAVAHEMGIIHRDLKPENIIVLEKSDDDGQRAELVKVCDFGMAKLVTPDQEGSPGGPLSSEKLTSHGVVVGTPDYMSPEQGKGERLDARSDLYAVGVILYQMLTRQLPFSAETPIATLLRHVIDEPQAPSEVDPDAHPGLESVCLRALAKRREDRFQSAREMRAEIRTAMEGKGASMGSQIPPPRLALGSIPDDGFAAFELRGPPRSVDLGAARAPALTPPQSHRIRAVEVLRDEPPPARRWTTPLAVVLVAGLAVATVAGYRHRKAVLAARQPAPAVVEPATPPVVASEPAPGPSPPPSPVTAAESERPPPVEGKAMVPTYAAPMPATLAVRGAPKVEPAVAPAPSSTVPTPAFGILAVPEVPKIAGAGPTNVAAPASPATPSSAPAPATDSFGHATVAFGAVRGDKVAAGDVLAALPGSRFNSCYRKGLSARGSAVGGSGTLHLSIDVVGHIGSATFAGAEQLASIGQCIAEAAIGANVKHVEAGATGADVDLSFHAE